MTGLLVEETKRAVSFKRGPLNSTKLGMIIGRTSIGEGSAKTHVSRQTREILKLTVQSIFQV